MRMRGSLSWRIPMLVREDNFEWLLYEENGVKTLVPYWKGATTNDM